MGSSETKAEPVASGNGISAGLIDGVLELPSRRVSSGRGRRASADPDQDALTLAADAGLALLARHRELAPDVLLLATSSPPYDEGGNVQLLAEVLGLSADTVALEFTSTVRDAFTAVRVAAALLQAGHDCCLLCASHRRRDDGESEAGDGAVALLLGRSGESGTFSCGPAHFEEFRDRWRLAGESTPRNSDPSLIRSFTSESIAATVAPDSDIPVTVVGTSGDDVARASSNESLAKSTGVLGAAHGLACALLQLETPQRIAVVAGGMTETLMIEPGPQAPDLSRRARAALDAGREGPEPPSLPPALDFKPYASQPRAWRERLQDLRLEATRCESCERTLYPPRLACPACGQEANLVATRLGRTGTVVTKTVDHVYPGGRQTGMAVVEVDGGGRFYGQVVPGEEVAVGDTARLVLRRLHTGGDFVQYFWKVAAATRASESN